VVQERSINLTFHGVGEPQRPLQPGEEDVWVDRDRFLSLLDSLARGEGVRITFDDGNASDLHHALPALRERGLSATFFVVAGRLGEPTFLDEDGVRELAGAGMEIGCHGMRHRPWRGLGDHALREELVEAKQRLEEVVERPVTDAACPFGSYDRRVVRSLRRFGYRRVYTSDRGTTRPGLFVQARNSVSPGDEPDLLERIAAADAVPHKALPRRAKLAVKRWR
jgi:peptidoglycan/xylan/chitin deacetylase (PgdA/CDA1 family)